jgi:hypothetical protein
MENIEIRQNKKTVIPMLFVLTIAFLGMNYYIYFSGKFDNNTSMKFLYVILNAFLLYSIYIPVKKLVKNEPILTFKDTEIEIYEKGKPISFIWQQVIDWKIEKDEDGGTPYLIVETQDKKSKLNISWLEKQPAEIEVLFQKYKPK